MVLCKPGQTTDNEYLSNCKLKVFYFDIQFVGEGSPAYEKFLELLATRTKLKDFKGFTGGLDTVHGRTGVDFLYTKWKKFEVMFHCSTLLPFNRDDHQQIERKRHIGNGMIRKITLAKI